MRSKTEDLPFPRSTAKIIPAQASWNKKLAGKLTDLSVADSSGKVLVSEVIEGLPENKTQVSLFDASGKKLWQISLDAPVRSQTLSQSGEWIFMSTYQEELIRLNPENGKILWKITETSMCRPIALEKSARVLCYHDDDASPGLVFEVFDSNGRKISELKAPSDPLVLKVSRDESRVLIGFVKGQIWMLGADLKRLWETKLNGEIADAAVASTSPHPSFVQAAILLNTEKSGQILVSIAQDGKKTQEVHQNIPLQQIELSEDGGWISVYGNGPRGQLVAQYDAEPQLQEKWSYHSPKYADYNLKMDLAGGWTVLGFENSRERTRFNHVVALDRLGSLQWHLPLPSKDGAYLYSTGVSRTSGLLVIGTDDGTISAHPLPIPN